MGSSSTTLSRQFVSLDLRHTSALIFDQVTIVTANGSILTASATENPDLFWGIRGGGCNFGVVTQFVLKLHPQRRTVFAGIIIYSADALEQVINLTDTWLSKIGENQTLMFILSTAPDAPATVRYFSYEAKNSDIYYVVASHHRACILQWA